MHGAVDSVLKVTAFWLLFIAGEASSCSKRAVRGVQIHGMLTTIQFKIISSHLIHKNAKTEIILIVI
jgi:hypothetical protein